MARNEATERAVRGLWEVGVRSGRTPDPTPEADPWEEDDAFELQREATVVTFRGVPTIEVRLFGDLQDTVVVQESIDLDVPRRDTVAVVGALLAGRARVRIAVHGPVMTFVATVLRSPFGAVLVVPVLADGGESDGAERTVYTAAVPHALSAAGWLWSLPIED